jgi:hypothetical protein
MRSWRVVAILFTLAALCAGYYFFKRSHAPKQMALVAQGPKHVISATQIMVWDFFPKTPCSIGVDNPDCPANGKDPATWNGICSNEAECGPLSAAELLPPGKKIVNTTYWAADGNLMLYPLAGGNWAECKGPLFACPINYSRWENVGPGYGKFKNWSGDKDRTAVLVAAIADK